MQFSSKEDIEVPIDSVFAMLSEFKSFERSAIRRGVDVRRLHEIETLSLGTRWHVRFTMRGKRREMDIELTAHEPPRTLEFTGVSEGIDAKMRLNLVALSPQRTRLSVVLNLKPKTLAARLFLQSLKLAKSLLTKRFKLRIAEYAKTLEDRHKRAGLEV